MYTRCMKRTNIYLDEQDKKDLAMIRVHYRLTSDAAAARLAIHKVAEEVRVYVLREMRQDREDGSTR